MNTYRLLLIDDEEEVLSSLGRALRCDGYEILKCRSAEDAFLIIAEQDFDLVICDYHLGGMDGISFLEKIARKKKEIPAVLITGSVDVDTLAQVANRLNLQGFISKPWGNDGVRKMVRDTLERVGRDGR
jgi:DNA-binding NtrC family response regulator